MIEPLSDHSDCCYGPHELTPLWQYNKRGFADTLFGAGVESLRELLADDKYLFASRLRPVPGPSFAVIAPAHCRLLSAAAAPCQA